MSQLSATNLPRSTRVFQYDRGAATTGILHFGVGNFHRAHQAVYCEDLLQQGDPRWAITGVSLRSASMQDALKPQDYIYSLAILGKTTDYRIIGAIKDILVAPRDPQAIIEKIANRSTHIVSSTITEKGYYLGANGIDFDHPNLAHDLKSLDSPKTIFGFVAAGILRRKTLPDEPAKLTIMCCDNISSGGAILKVGVLKLLEHHRAEARTWAAAHVTFISTMVDRVCPATTDKLRERVFRATGKKDAHPVSAEPFTQWIIEDNFARVRPPFDKVGATFVDDIAPFERMKLAYLNAGHTIVSTLGYLFGDTYVHEAVARPNILQFMRQALENNVLPNAPVPEGYDGQQYIDDTIRRFKNQNLPYANLQVGTDSSQKIQQRWFPTIDQALQSHADTSYFQFSLAAWVTYIKVALDTEVLNDPKLEAFQKVKPNDLSEQTLSYLRIADAQKFAFMEDGEFIQGVNKFTETILADGIDKSLSNFIETRA